MKNIEGYIYIAMAVGFCGLLWMLVSLTVAVLG